MVKKIKDQPIASVAGPAKVHVTSIDIVRALTMILMIFVNDLWSLKDIPEWLEHVERGVDGIGLADVVFPAFLFIVGLSLPYAVNNRRKKGDTDWQLTQHVLCRTVALLVMGVFLVNGETINTEASGMPRPLWNTVCCLSFILIWNTYSKVTSKILPVVLRVAGVVVLIIMAILYRGGEAENIYRFGPQWWGILGLIGWSYLAAGLVTVYARNNFYVILGGWIFFAALSMFSKAGFVPEFLSFIPDAIRGGTLAGLTMGGVLTSMIFQYYRDKNDNIKLTVVLTAFAAVLILLSILTRPYWQLAKLGATPAWLFLCSAFTILAFLVVYWIADVKGKSNWFNLIRPAGTDTLLCYLIPYFAYATTFFLGVHLLEAILIGGVGLFKSFLFALLCAVITGWLIKLGIRLKL
jgi:heparan-alpha-glucosaminide N-acetyltransferase